MFITIVAGIFDPRSGRVELANAGHLPALKLDRNGHFESYPAAGPPLGVAPELAFPTQVIELDGGSLYLYTDGLLEAPLPGGKRLGESGVKQLIRRHHAKSPRERLHAMVVEVQRPDSTGFDDLTLLLIEPAAHAS